MNKTRVEIQFDIKKTQNISPRVKDNSPIMAIKKEESSTRNALWYI